MRRGAAAPALAALGGGGLGGFVGNMGRLISGLWLPRRRRETRPFYTQAGGGTVGIPACAKLSWSTGGGTLGLTQQLVGQPTTIDPWGVPCAAAQQPMWADFNLYSRFFITGSGDPFAPTAAATPTLIAPFILDTDGGAPPGDRMFLMSFAPVNDPASVPVPIVGAGLPGLISVGGLLGWWLGRQKKPPKLLSKSQRRIAVNATIAKRTPRRKGSTFISE